MIKATFINSTLTQYTDKDISWVQELLLSKGYLADKDTGSATFQVTENSPNAHSVIVGAGHLLADFTKSGKTWKVKIQNDSALVLSVPQNTSGVTKYVHIIVKIDNTVEPNAVGSNVASIVAVSLTTATPSAGDIQGVIGAGMDYYSLGYVTQVNNNPVITNAIITNQSTKVTLSKAIDIPSTNVIYASGYFSGSSYPSTPFVGQWFYKTTAPIGQQFWNGSAWQLALTSADAPTKKDNYTANGAISSKDVVIVTSNDTVKKISPSGFSTPASLTTPRTTYGVPRSLPLSTAGMYVHIQGGNIENQKKLSAQVVTMNAGETDFANGTEAIIYNTGNGVRWYDVCQIGVDKFLFIFQTDTGGSPAGIKCAVISISGTTITVGTIQTIESTGGTSYFCACAKLDTDKAIIFYRKDADGFLYGQVLTVSGTTISTNTAYACKSTNASYYGVSATDTATGAGVVVFAKNSDSNLYARAYTVSGTAITFNTENSLFTTSTSQQFYCKLGTISATKLLLCYEDQGTPPVTSKCATIDITSGGATLTMSSTLQLSTENSTRIYGMTVISQTFALVASVEGDTSYKVWFINISSTTPTSVSSYAVGHTTTSYLYHGCAVVKVAPWTYVIEGGGSNADGDYIFKLTPESSNFIGVAESAIADTATGAILKRFLKHTIWSGLTAGSKYYVDDNGQETIKPSLTAPVLGIATSATDMQLL